MNNFTMEGHSETANSSGGPAVKMDRTTVTESGEITTKSSVVTGKMMMCQQSTSERHIPCGAM